MTGIHTLKPSAKSEGKLRKDCGNLLGYQLTAIMG